MQKQFDCRSRPPTHSFCALRMGAITSTVRARTQRFSYLHFRRSAALGALRHRSGQRNLPLGRGMLLGTGML